MKLLSKKHITIAGILLILLGLHSGCTKEQIAPPNQSVAFVKYYGHVEDQTGVDLKKTLDGGYILAGSTNSYSSENESDMLIVKTDSLGQELWSTALGKAAGNYTGSETSMAGKFIRYDEKAVRIIELPGGAGYTVIGNRTYVSYLTASGSVPFNPEVKTKIVLYQLDAAGVPTSINGVELKSNNAFTERASDMKLDTANGAFKYVLTGYTTNVLVTKNGHDPVTDKTDVFTAVLDISFNILWTDGVLAYGFGGNDYGVSIQIIPDAYVVTGTRQENQNSNDFYTQLLAVRMNKSNGIPLGTNFGGDQNYNLVGGNSVYDATNRKITITGSVVEGSNGIDTYKGSAVVYQLNDNLFVTSVGTGNVFGFKYFKPTPTTSLPPATQNYYRPQSIALLPDDAGFIISNTHEKNNIEHNIAIMNLNANLELQSGWPFYFGYEDVSGGFATKEVAGAIIPVSAAIAGTSQSTLKGYAFTGTFGVGTNNMMGLVKINSNGTLNP